jgi:CRP-like cAMP-binding protein/chromosome segregation ATPase
METASRKQQTLSPQELARLRSLVPLHTLPDDAFSELLVDAGFETLRKGGVLFEQGATDHENVYLLEGSVALISNDAEVDKVSAGSDTARFPLAHQLPRKQGARAKTPVRIVRVDSRRLSELLARTRTVDYQVTDLDDASEDDWMSMLLQSRVLQQVPASNIQRVMMSVEQVEVAKGEDLIVQGDAGDYYYMLTRGRAVVRRDSGDGKGSVELATLGPGDAFGEEALLSDKPRNSTVTMLHDGHVLRLNKASFLNLIHNPLLDRIDRDTAEAKVADGAVWLDLRTSEQYDESHLSGAINFPFESLRYQASSLAPDRHYVLYSNTGGRAMAGAFLLTERGFDVSVLDGGLGEEEIEQAVDEKPSVAPLKVAATEDDEVIKARIQEAESRAHELEEQLELAQRNQASVDEERQHHLQQVRVAVDQARRKLIETEQQKREAEAEKEKAYAEMDALTSNLEQMENERESLRDRMSEIEGLDKQLQARLAKAERELIGERERAESATSSLEELTDRLNELAQQREDERDQHAQQQGELKEELTALQLDLEQARADLQAAADDLRSREGDQARQQAELTTLRDDNEALAKQISTLQDELKSRADALAEQEDSRTSQEAAASAAAAEIQALQGQLEELRSEAQSERERLQQQLEAAQSQLTETQEQAETARSEQAQMHEQQMAELQASVEQLRGDKQSLQAQLAQGDAEAGSAIEQAHARASELERELSGEREALAALRTEKDDLYQQHEALLGRLQTLESERENGVQALAEQEARLADAEQTAQEQATVLQQQIDAATGERDGLAEQLQVLRSTADADATAAGEKVQSLQSELEQLRSDNTALRQELAQNGEATGAALAQSEARVEALEQELSNQGQKAESDKGELQRALEQAGSEHAAAVDALEQKLAERTEALTQQERQLETLAQEHAAELSRLQAEADTAAQARDTAEAESSSLREQLQQMEKKVADQSVDYQKLQDQTEALRSEQAHHDSDVHEALDQMRAEKQELESRLEEKLRALAAARDEQAELIEALNAAGAERETLQFALNDRDDEQARLVDLENQVAEAIRNYEKEQLAHEQAQREWQEVLDAERAARREVEVRLIDAGESDGEATAGLLKERDALRAELQVRDGEVEQLRGVMEQYVDQIRGTQSGDEDGSEVEALRAELEMVREQAIQDVAHMREQLALAETEKRRLHDADGREAISFESMRQRIDELEASLSERQRELTQADESRHVLEDELEDANRNIDTFSRDLEKARVDTEEALFARREAEVTRDELQQALDKLREDSESMRAIDLRDDRLASSQRPIGLDSGGSRGWLAGLIGAALVLGGLQALSFWAGHGELFTALLRLSGP